MVAGTHHAYLKTDSPLVILLAYPQLGENIGAVARAMLNFGVTTLRLINPRDGWPNPQAFAPAAGAEFILEKAKTFLTLEAAVSDLQVLYATTVRPRELIKPVYDLRTAAPLISDQYQLKGLKIGILFGSERTGLTNEDISLSNAMITIPLNPGFSSLNLAQAVLLVLYELSSYSSKNTAPFLKTDEQPCIRSVLTAFLQYLSEELKDCAPTPQHHKKMWISLKSLFYRHPFTQQEIQTLFTMVKNLARKKHNSY